MGTVITPASGYTGIQADTIAEKTSDVGVTIDSLLVKDGDLPNLFNWTTWSPTYTPSGAMTYGSVTTSVAKYFQVGSVVVFIFNATGTVAGTPDTEIEVSLPVTSAVANIAVAASITDNGTRIGGNARISTTDISFRRYDTANLTAGTVVLYGAGIYEAA